MCNAYFLVEVVNEWGVTPYHSVSLWKWPTGHESLHVTLFPCGSGQLDMNHSMSPCFPVEVVNWT